MELSEQCSIFGFNCGGGITWGGGTWVPGNSYTKTIKIQNITNSVNKNM